MKQSGSNSVSVYTYFKEAYHQSKRPILTFVGGLAAIWGAFNSLLSQITGWYVFSLFALLGIVYAIWKYFSWFSRIAKGRMSVEIFKGRNVTLLRDGYPENMKKLLSELSRSELEQFAFIMGIDRSGQLKISTKGGVVFAVLRYLNHHYRCEEENRPIDVAQRQLDNFLKDYPRVDKINKLAYGTCVEIHLNLHPLNAPDVQPIPCNLVFIANSRKKEPGNTEKAEAVSDDNQSNIIVPQVFDYLLSANKYKGAMIGVMGTNGMRQPYQVIFSQTINQFARICSKDKHNPLSKMYISIRESDYVEWNMTLSQLGDYVRQCVRYYNGVTE